MSDTNRIPVTAVVPIKNGQFYFHSIKKELEKTLNTMDQIIIIDDNSSDDTFQLYKNWSTKDSRVQVLKNKIPGLANALNFGIMKAQHKWIARFDQDDLYHPNRIQIQLDQVTKETAVVFSDQTFRTNTGMYLGSQVSALFPSCVSISLISNRRTPHPVALINKEAFQTVGGYLQKHFPAEDLSLWLRLAQIGELRSAPIQLLSYTLNKTGISQSNRHNQIIMRNKVYSEIGTPKSDIKNVHENLFLLTENYNLHDKKSARVLMLLEDYLNICKKNNIKINYLDIRKTIMSNSLLDQISSYSDTLFWALLRKLYRNIF